MLAHSGNRAILSGKRKTLTNIEVDREVKTTSFDQKLILALGIGALVFVPVFRTLTGLPPFMGILFGLGILWLVTEMIHRGKKKKIRMHIR